MTGSCNNLDGTYECRCPDAKPYGDGRIGGIGCYSLAELQGGIIGFSGQSSDVETVSTTNENDKNNNNVANQIKETVIQIDLPVSSNITTTQTSKVTTTKFTTTTTKAKTTTITATTSTRKMTTTTTTRTTTTEATTSHVEVLIAEFTSPIINNDFDCAGQGLVCDFFRNDSKSLKIS